MGLKENMSILRRKASAYNNLKPSKLWKQELIQFFYLYFMDKWIKMYLEIHN